MDQKVGLVSICQRPRLVKCLRGSEAPVYKVGVHYFVSYLRMSHAHVWNYLPLVLYIKCNNKGLVSLDREEENDVFIYIM